MTPVVHPVGHHAPFNKKTLMTVHDMGQSVTRGRWAGSSCVQQATRQHMYAFYWMLLAMNTGIRYFDTAKVFLRTVYICLHARPMHVLRQGDISRQRCRR